MFEIDVFRFVALVPKKLYFRFFFTNRLFFRPVPCTIHKVTKFHGHSVKNDRASTKKLPGGWVRSPPACLGLTNNLQ